MARVKHTARKRRLAKAGRQKSSVPMWIVAKTMGRFRSHPKRKPWRRTKLKI